MSNNMVKQKIPGIITSLTITADMKYNINVKKGLTCKKKKSFVALKATNKPEQDIKTLKKKLSKRFMSSPYNLRQQVRFLDRSKILS